MPAGVNVWCVCGALLGAQQLTPASMPRVSPPAASAQVQTPQPQPHAVTAQHLSLVHQSRPVPPVHNKPMRTLNGPHQQGQNSNLGVPYCH